VLRTARLVGAVKLDGRLDEPAWRTADAAGDFVQQYPKDRAPASERTEARVLYDGQALYVGVRAFDRTPGRIAAQLARRDATGIYSDWIHVVLDSYHDRRTAFRFSVNPKGVQKDVRHFDDGNEDVLWDAVWEVATAVDAQGWTAEYRIPLSQLRYASARRGGAAGAAAPAAAASSAAAPSSAAATAATAAAPAAGDSAAARAGAALARASTIAAGPVTAGLTMGGSNATGLSTAGVGEYRWGLQVSRDIARLQERSNWAPIAQNANGYVSRFGDLAGLDGLAAPRRVEVVPYVSNRVSRLPGDPANPFYRRTALRPSAGGDFRLGVGSGLTLTGTVNPDFGQVELDPAVVNLTAFEVFLPERRPFFVEGGEIFNYGRLIANNTSGGNQLFYSRRLGRAPQRSALGADAQGRRPAFADAPTETSIYGAAKLSGKTAGGWSVGVLDAVTSGEEARLQQLVAGATTPGAGPLDVRRTTPVEPPTNYLVARTRRDFNAGRTVVGGVLTNVARDLTARDRPYDQATGTMTDGPEVFRSLLARTATVAGVDVEHNWHGRDYTLSGYATGSQVAGSRQMIASLQRAPYRLFQRPDGGRAVDTTRTALAGYSAGLAVSKRGGRHWTGSLAYQEYSPGYEINDAGFGQTADRRAGAWLVSYNENRPTGRMARFRNYGAYAFGNHIYNFDGLNVFEGYGAGFNAQEARRLWSYNVQARAYPRHFTDRLLRGGPVAVEPASWSVNPNVTTDPRRPLVLSAHAFVRGDESGERNRDVGVTFDTRPRSNVRVTLDPSLARSRVTDQYVQRTADPLAAATAGARYVFATVDQTTALMTARVNYTLTPRASLEVVAQPFVTAGRFSGYKEFRTPRTYDFAVYGRDGASTFARDSTGAYRADPDGAGPAPAFGVGDQNFTFRSLRGSAVARWEYRPGSTLFLVWQQQRSGSLADGRFDARRDLGAVFREPARNVFLVKATYWLSR
jgi:hypothetical protein